MTQIEDRLRAMLRGRLAERERTELEAWFFLLPKTADDAALEVLQRLEHEVLEAWMADELAPDEAATVLLWRSAQRRRELLERVENQSRFADETSATTTSRWVM